MPSLYALHDIKSKEKKVCLVTLQSDGINLRVDIVINSKE